MGSFLDRPSRRNAVFQAALCLAALLGVGLSAGLAQAPAIQAASPVPRALEWERWFYGQRSYGLGHIPEGALTRAVEQRDRPPSVRGFDRLPSTPLRAGTTGGYRTLAESLPEAASERWVGLGPGGISSIQNDLVSGRVTSLALDPRAPSTVYVAAAGGGVWKSTNRGARWSPLTDSLPSLASGAVAVDPFSGDVWYGTGELNFCRDCYYGAGVFRSSDGGATWLRISPESFLSSPTSVIVFDRRNRGTLFIGRSTALWKSSDGGQSWQVVLRGAVTDFVLNPADSSIAYAAIGNFSGSPENGVYRSADGGETWTRLSEGLPPQASLGRIALGTAPSAPSIVYALIIRSTDFNLNGLYRSLDGGNTWSLIPSLPADIFTEDGQGQGAFNLFVRVDPRDAAVLYIGARDLWKSTDFGVTWQNLSTVAGLHEDQRDIVFDPTEPATLPQTFYLIGDSGVWRSSNGGQSFANLNSTLAVTQFQTVGLHPSNPNLAVGGTQDNGTVFYRGAFAWDQGRAGDSGAAFFDSANPRTVYTVARRLSVRRSDDGGRTFRVIAEGLATTDRVQFYPPLIADPTQPGTLYFGTQRVWRSQDGGEHWTPLSEDLTGGGSATVTALAVAPSSSPVLYAGSSDGRVQFSGDGGGAWSLAAPLPSRFVTSIAVHPQLPARAFVGLSGFGTGHIFRTDNAGASWEDMTRNLPDIPVNAVLVDALSPDRVYLGTDIGVFVLGPDGAWVALNQGMPNAVVLGLSQNPATGLLVAATHGRGAFALLLGDPAATAPRIDSVANAAGLENTPVAPGMTVALIGSSLAAASAASTSATSLPLSLAGASITVNGVPAPLFSVAPGEVNFLVPFGITGPMAEVILRNGSGEAAVRVYRADASPGIFLNGTEANVFHANGTRVWDFSPARPGEELVLFASGLGAVDPAVPAGSPTPPSPAVKTLIQPAVRVGGRPAETRFAGLTPGSVGLYQVNFIVPSGLLSGPVPVVLESAGTASNVVTLPVVP
ncbi:MAG: hypothetical protein A3H28_16600 [Acidobacteria bacterium RIFCSPLOWO2_02_FULL_61_28]|nr:MAG: hypothetical protein A3H28_16600 [Acidobacteria bacterium RIFCSPLOWO2_02_FULL_61_28]